MQKKKAKRRGCAGGVCRGTRHAWRGEVRGSPARRCRRPLALPNLFEAMVRANFRFGRMCGA